MYMLNSDMCDRLSESKDGRGGVLGRSLPWRDKGSKYGSVGKKRESYLLMEYGVARFRKSKVYVL
jgi:hypothetical protein